MKILRQQAQSLVKKKARCNFKIKKYGGQAAT